MKLGNIQLISLAAKVVTTVLGIVQSIIVVRILSPAEFGIVGLVVSIGSVVGVSQHLGVVDGAVREIAVQRAKDIIGKVFWVSHLARQLITLPLSIALFFFAFFIADGIYGQPAIAGYIQIFALILILQGFQDVLGATLAGMKRFIPLYIIQIVTAGINIAVFSVLVWMFGIAGFFLAMGVTTIIMALCLLALIVRDLRGNLKLPSRKDIRIYGAKIMSIGVFMYIARIFFVLWQRLPLLILGGALAADDLGFINISLTFGSKLTIIAMALSYVNLSWMSSLYARNKGEFTHQVTRNMSRVSLFMLSVTLALLFFTPEILRYVVGEEYMPAAPLAYLITSAFFLYALVDVGTSSIFVPAGKPRMRMITFGILVTISSFVIAWVYIARPDPFLASIGMVCGAIASYLYMIHTARRFYGISLLSPSFAILLTLLAGSVVWLLQEPALPGRIAVFILFSGYTLWEAWRRRLLPSMGFRKRGDDIALICFAGASYDREAWTNRQHIMSRMSESYRVLYIEPRVWIVRYVAENIRSPGRIARFLLRVCWYERVSDTLYIKAQFNLIPGSRSYPLISRIHHVLNAWNILLFARLLGIVPWRTFRQMKRDVVWIYDTQAVQYLTSFPGATVVYDCVDDHASQEGVNKHADEVISEESRIISRADLVTVTSRNLFDRMKGIHSNVHLVLNAGDVETYRLFDAIPATVSDIFASIPRPIFGSVGALDSYKVDFDLLYDVAVRKPEWQFVFVGAPVVDTNSSSFQTLQQLPNIHVLGAVHRKRAPAYVRHFDVCMIPYRENVYNKSSFPLKFWEFMATGKPIIVSGLPELKAYEAYISYIRSADEFVRAGETVLQDAGNKEERMKLSKQHTWDHRTQELKFLLEKTIGTTV